MLNVPNILTLIRLLFAPMLVVVFLYFTRPYADWIALILFIFAAITDWIDGFLARLWKQSTKIGKMLDPIADKAMVVIALMVIAGLSDMDPYILLPATVIIFREIFISGLREFLGKDAAVIRVTLMAKWKTTLQMLAISTLFAVGIFEHHLLVNSFGMDRALLGQILTGAVEDTLGLRFYHDGMIWSLTIGIALLWIAALLTLITGIEYLRKTTAFLKERQ